MNRRWRQMGAPSSLLLLLAVLQLGECLSPQRLADSALGGARAGSSSSFAPLRLSQLPGETLFLLDGTSLLYRAHHRKQAESYLAADGATEVGAVRAMGVWLARFLRDVSPRYVAVAFDVDRSSTFRRKLMPEYKAQRPPYPQDLLLQALVDALGCRWYSMEGYEADDIMATLARWATTGRRAGLGAVLVSDDKDMHQLVRDRVHLLQTRSLNWDGDIDAVLLGAADIQQLHGLPPERLVDMTGLVGDAADNIPGVRTVGPKKACALLQQFASLEEVFDRAAEVSTWDMRGSAGLSKILMEDGAREQAMLCRQLARLHDEVPLEGLEELVSQELRWNGPAQNAEAILAGVLGFAAPLHILAAPRSR